MFLYVRRVVERLHLPASRRRRAEWHLVDPAMAETLARVAHELRQPLGAALAALQVIRSSTHQTRRDEAAAVADRQLQRLARLIDDLMEMTRLRVHRPSLHISRFDLRHLAQEVVDALAPHAAAKRQHLSIGISQSGVTVHGDPVRMQQVLSNLITNAIKYTERGGFIRVSIENKSGAAVLTVTDTGRGIPRELRQRIFDPFVQGDRGSMEGLGLGLAVARQLVELQGGSIRVESQGPGCGSTFVVTLPAERSPRSAQASAVNRLH